MGDRDVASDHEFSTPPHDGSNTGDVSMSSKKRKNMSKAWKHFNRETQASTTAECNYCNSSIKCNNGTSSMISHSRRCKSNPNNVSNVEGCVGSSPSIVKFDQEKCRKVLVELFVAMELPFRGVEHPAFRKFVRVLEPRFKCISRSTLTRDTLSLWSTEKIKLKSYLSQHSSRVCLTTDTWTCQNYDYMCLTAHFIDDNWNLQKKVLNFRQVTSHTGEGMSKAVEACLVDWELNRVLCITVDNATSNDLGIGYLKKRLKSWSDLVLNGDYLHMRCCAHILNLVVKDGLKEIDDSILRIRAAVKYVRSTNGRLDKFKVCVEQQKIDYRGLVFIDCETRWNSTYLMLEAAVKHQKSFEELEMVDAKFVEELLKGKDKFAWKGVPTSSDWDHARLVIPFLKTFFEATLCVSGSSYVTSNIYILEVLGIGKKIKEMCRSNETTLKRMADRMEDKYNKYWGQADTFNMLMFIALVLDPRYKLNFQKRLIHDSFELHEASYLISKLDECLKSIFEEYKGVIEGSQGDNSQERVQFQGESSDDRYGYNQYFDSSGSKNELAKYLEEGLEERGPLDILNWWKLNASRYPVLASIARELLAIPISTVASESTFSTGGRVVDQYRSSLTPRTLEALICTQNWIKGESPTSVLSNEEFTELENYEQELLSTQDVAYTTSIGLEED